MSKKSLKSYMSDQFIYWDDKQKKAILRTVKRNSIAFNPESPSFWNDIEQYQTKLVGKVPRNLKTEFDLKIPPLLIPDTIFNGEVSGIEKDFAIINIGKTDAFVAKSEFDKDIEIGTKTFIHYDGKNFSHTKAKREMLRAELFAAMENKEPIFFDAKVVELIYGGYWLDCGGIRCFMPGSLANVIRLTDFNSILNTTLKVCAVGIEKGKIILSHRDYLKRFGVIRSNEYKKGQHAMVIITGQNETGYFVEVEENVYGMILKDNTNSQYSVGDEMETLVLGHDHRGRLMFTQNARDILEVGHVLTGKVLGYENDLAIIELMEGVNGTIFKDKLKFVKEGQLIEVIVSKIFKNKIFLRVR
jgi:ribosomal protein S1